MRNVIASLTVGLALALGLTLAAPPGATAVSSKADKQDPPVARSGPRATPAQAVNRFNQGKYGFFASGTAPQRIFKNPSIGRKILVDRTEAKLSQVLRQQRGRALSRAEAADVRDQARARVNQWVAGTRCLYSGRDYYVPQPCLSSPRAPLTDDQVRQVKIALCGASIVAIFGITVFSGGTGTAPAAGAIAGIGGLQCFWANAPGGVGPPNQN